MAQATANVCGNAQSDGRRRIICKQVVVPALNDESVLHGFGQVSNADSAGFRGTHQLVLSDLSSRNTTHEK